MIISCTILYLYLLLSNMIPEKQAECTVSVLSYNTLVEKSGFTNTVKNDPPWRSYGWQSRREQLILKMIEASPLIICLQEIRHVSQYATPNFQEFKQPLWEMGFEGVFAKRNLEGEFGQEGLAIFYNRQHFALVQTDVLYFQDGTGRHALAATLRSREGCVFTVATTHIIYPSQQDKTQAQIDTLTEWALLHKRNLPCFLAGDFNIISPLQSTMLKGLNERFHDSHEKTGCKNPTFSLNLTGSNSPGMICQPMGCRIDYIFSSKDITITDARVLGSISDLSLVAEPSDHLPVYGIYQVPVLNKTLAQDFKTLRQLFLEVRERNYNTSPRFQQFLDLFWLLPRSIKNVVYELTYKKAVELNIYEQNQQFGRIAFTNNTYHIETILDGDGRQKNLKWEVVTHDVIPHEVINEILKITQQRIIILPELIKTINEIAFKDFINKFDEWFSPTNCNEVYGQTYKVASEKGIYNQHLQYGRFSFRQMEGWTISNEVRVQAMRRLLLP